MHKGAGIVLLLGIAALVATGFLRTTTRAYSLGVTPVGVAADLVPGAFVCQRGVRAPRDVGPLTAIQLRGRATGRMRTRFEVRIDEAKGQGALPATDGADAVIRLDRKVRLDKATDVCIRALGPTRLQLFGNAGVAVRTSEAIANGQSLGTDLAMVFRGAAQSWVERMPSFVRRAALWRAGWVEPWTLSLVLGTALCAGPALLLYALRALR